VKISDLRNGMLDFGLQLNGKKLQGTQGVSIRNVGTVKTFS
jgi:hypothetical protein